MCVWNRAVRHNIKDILINSRLSSATMTNLPIELMRHYREEADRVRNLADQAVLPGIRDALLGVVRQYEDLAENLDDRQAVARTRW